jgi:hypothetical protein
LHSSDAVVFLGSFSFSQSPLPVYVRHEINNNNEIGYDHRSPLLGTLVFIRIASRCETIGKSRFFLDKLTPAHICANNSSITNDFNLPFTVNLFEIEI